jgi:hypothetical protein
MSRTSGEEPEAGKLHIRVGLLSGVLVIVAQESAMKIIVIGAPGTIGNKVVGVTRTCGCRARAPRYRRLHDARAALVFHDVFSGGGSYYGVSRHCRR